MAEPPRLFEPRWSDEIIDETTRTLRGKLGWPGSLVDHFVSELHAHFDDAWIDGYQFMVPCMTNDTKDRHVAAAAVHGGAEMIVMLNVA